MPDSTQQDRPRFTSGTDDVRTEGPPSGSRLRAVDVVLVIGLTVGFLLLAGWLVSRLSATLEVVLGMLTLQSAVPLACVHLVVVRRRGLSWGELGMRTASRHWYRRAVLIALIAVPGVAAVNLAVQSFFGTPFHNPQLELLTPSGFSWGALVGTLIVTGAIAPLAEEVVFRGLFYGWLRRHMRAPTAIPVSAALFSLAHGIVLLVPALFVMGAVLALVFERSRSLVPAIIVHGIFNATMVAAYFVSLAANGSPQ